MIPISASSIGSVPIGEMPARSALGLDIGKKRIGVAGCDGLGLCATGLVTIDRRSMDQVIAELTALAVERQAQVLVVGYPLNMDGTAGPQAKQTVRVAEIFSKALNLPIDYVDELSGAEFQVRNPNAKSSCGCGVSFSI